jgi:hypothetical protein
MIDTMRLTLCRLLKIMEPLIFFLNIQAGVQFSLSKLALGCGRLAGLL